MFISIANSVLLSLGLTTGGIFLVAIFGFKFWRSRLKVVDADGYKTYRNDAIGKARYAQVETATALFMKYLHPLMLLWVTGISLGLWIVLRVVLSFTS